MSSSTCQGTSAPQFIRAQTAVTPVAPLLSARANEPSGARLARTVKHRHHDGVSGGSTWAPLTWFAAPAHGRMEAGSSGIIVACTTTGSGCRSGHHPMSRFAPARVHISSPLENRVSSGVDRAVHRGFLHRHHDSPISDRQVQNPNARQLESSRCSLAQRRSPEPQSPIRRSPSG
jgi:hypothetical protein